MNQKCDLDLRDCDRDAVYRLKLTDKDTGWTLDRVCCDRHIGWFRQEYVKDLNYTMETKRIDPTVSAEN